MKRCFVLIALCLLAGLFLLAVPSRYVRKDEAVCPTCPPAPPPPPTAGHFGGPLAGLTTSVTNLFNGGYGNFVVKWDPIGDWGRFRQERGVSLAMGQERMGS